MATDSNERIRMLSRVATEYYVDGRTVAEIAANIDESTEETARLLEAARSEGVIQVAVRTPWQTDEALEQRVKERFSLKAVRVLKRANRSEPELIESLGVVAAHILSGILKPNSVIGISWGRALHRMITALPPMSLPKAEVVQLIGATGNEELAIDGPMLAQLLSNRLGCSCRYLHAPLVVESEAGRNALFQERTIRDTLQRGEEADIALVGIGATTPMLNSLVQTGYLNLDELAELRSSGAVGDICAQHYSATGEWLDIDINRRVVGISLNGLSQIETVIGVAGGADKAATVLAALRGKHVNMLVTDDETAEAVLALDEGRTVAKSVQAAPATAQSVPGEVRASLKSVWKVFDGVPVLRGVDIELRRGQIHALLGGNGSGKSTLMKILSGIYMSDAGSIELDGVPVTITNPSAAHRLGIYLVPQEPKIFPHLSVVENLLLGTAVSAATAVTQIGDLTTELGFEADLASAAGNLNIANQQLLEIMRGLLRDARILILDEPTSTLTLREVDALFSRLHKLAARGIGIFFISHRLNEILAVSDWVSVLRDGAFVLSAPTGSVRAHDLIRAMLPVGESEQVVSGVITKSVEPSRNRVLDVSGLSGDMFRDVSLSIHAGEVVGLAGLVGAGRTELAKAIVGIDKATSGTVAVGDLQLSRRTPSTCQDAGLVYVPEDRHSYGIFLNLPNLYTITASILHKLGSPLLSAEKEYTVGRQFVDELKIKVSGPDQLSRTLSGGNQQKTVLAKSLASKPRVVILDEPTRGIDAKARVDVYELIRELTDQGLGVLLISSDFEEVIHLSDRVLVMYHGTIVDQLPRSLCRIERITAAAFGLKETRSA